MNGGRDFWFEISVQIFFLLCENAYDSYVWCVFRTSSGAKKNVVASAKELREAETSKSKWRISRTLPLVGLEVGQ